jgi:hypothetical protein
LPFTVANNFAREQGYSLARRVSHRQGLWRFSRSPYETRDEPGRVVRCE